MKLWIKRSKKTCGCGYRQSCFVDRRMYIWWRVGWTRWRRSWSRRPSKATKISACLSARSRRRRPSPTSFRREYWNRQSRSPTNHRPACMPTCTSRSATSTRFDCTPHLNPRRWFPVTRKVLDRETYQPCWTIKNSGTLDPDPVLDCHQNLLDWFLGRAPPLQKISSKYVRNLQRRTAKCQFTPYMLMVRNICGKMIQDAGNNPDRLQTLIDPPWASHHLSTKFHQNPFITFRDILHTHARTRARAYTRARTRVARTHRVPGVTSNVWSLWLAGCLLLHWV